MAHDFEHFVFPPVVRCDLHRARGGYVHLSADQRVRRVPVRRGRDALVVMGMHVTSVK
jgi:hypothetical protein